MTATLDKPRCTHREETPVREPSVRTIDLWRRDGDHAGTVLVDAEDFERLGPDGWCLSDGGYAVRREGSRIVRMHRAILGLTAADQGVEVDHINRSRLDNRRVNLRRADRSLNGQNLPSFSGSTSEYRGVSAYKGQWRAQGKKTKNGVVLAYFSRLFRSEMDAAAAAAQWRSENLPGSVEDPDLLTRTLPPADPAKRLTEYEALALAMAQASTTLSRRQMCDLFQVGHHAIKAHLGPGSKRKIKCLHHESDVSIVKPFDAVLEMTER